MDKTHKTSQPKISISHSSQGNPNPEVINLSGLDINDQNGINDILSKMDGLPPETQQKIRNAMEKIQGNPGIMNMLKMGMDISKAASQNGGVYVKTFTTKAGAQFANNPSSISINNQNSANVHSSTPTKIQPTRIHQRDPITFNPDIKKDNWRRQVLIVGLLIIGAYLIFKYVYNGQLPF
ncbi:hypothetical protein IT411_01650 [Candidatus Peregrinibacteria bacterium]|nr:hypothetical protein [Candidatus Peregrinibacteria bacterium]